MFLHRVATLGSVLALWTFGLCPEASAQADEDTGQGARAEVQDGVPVVEIVFKGLESYNREGVLAALGLEVGAPYPTSSRAGLLKVWDTYRIIIGEPLLEKVPGGLRVTLPVTELPLDLDPSFVGNAEVSLEELKEWALLFDREQVYIHEADRIRARMLAGYRRNGYHFVEIDNVVGGLGQGVAGDLIFEIREGPQVRCTAIEVRGNEGLPDTGWGFFAGGLMALAELGTKGLGLFRWWGGVFDKEILEADVIAMRQVYRDRGWLDAQVEVERLEFSADRSSVKVYFVVDEGALWRVGGLDLVAVDPEDRETRVDLLFPLEELRQPLQLKPGVPFERSRIVYDRGELTRFYGARGHLEQRYFKDPNARGTQFLEPLLVYDWEKKEVLVTYRVVQGRRRYINEIKIVGNTHTTDKVLRRQLEFMPGDLANIREIERGLARVRGTGYFEDPFDPTHEVPQVTFSPVEGDEEKIDVEYSVSEGRVVDFNISGGVASDSGIVGLLTLSMRNFAAGELPTSLWGMPGEIYRKEAFHGNGEAFALDLSPGSQVSYWRLMYSHPDIFGTHHDRYTVRAEVGDRDRRYESHDEKRSRGSLLIGRLFDAGDLSMRLGPRWQQIDVKDITDPENSPQTLLDSAGATEFVGFSADLFYYQLDNRRSPRAGYAADWTNTVYGGLMGGDQDIWKTEVGYDFYHLLGEPGDGVQSGIYFGGAVGVAQPFDDTQSVHYSERFFLGGSSTLRGFDFRGVGPNQGNFAIGGETMIRGTAEYRLPIYSTPIPGTSREREMFRMIGFVDAGVLGGDSWNVDLDETRASVGFGFGIVYPVPISLNFGFPIRKGEGDERETFSFRLDFFR